MKKYRKKLAVIEALQFTGNNVNEVLKFAKNSFTSKIVIPTSEDYITAEIGDYIIKDDKEQFYICKPSTFYDTYEEVID